MARSSRDLLNVIKQVTDAGATFKSLKDHWADTTTAHGRLILTVLAGLAEFERELIVERTGEGRERAQWLAAWAAGPARFPQPRQPARALTHFAVSILETVRPERLKEQLQSADDSLAARFSGGRASQPETASPPPDASPASVPSRQAIRV